MSYERYSANITWTGMNDMFGIDATALRLALMNDRQTQCSRKAGNVGLGSQPRLGLDIYLHVYPG